MLKLNSIPKFTIVMPAYNAAAYIEAAIESVRAQSRTDWELVIVDDGSTDQTRQIAQRYTVQDPRIHLLRQPRNEGPAAARNRAISVGQGRYVAFLDADDRWLPDKLERQITFMEAHGHAFSFTAFWRVRDACRTRVPAVHSVGYDQLLKQNVIGCLTVMYDQKKLGLCAMPDLPMRQDYGMWLALLKKVPLAYGLDEALSEYNDHKGSLSSHKMRALVNNWRLLHRIEELSLPVSAWYLGHVLFHRMKRALPLPQAKV